MSNTIEIGAGILGVGAYLPDEVRYNSWWPSDVVAKWREQMSAVLMKPLDEVQIPHTEGVQRAKQALSVFGNDPFFGIEKRHVAPDGVFSSDLEARAGALALDDSGVDPNEIDLLLVQSMVPDYNTFNQAAAVHYKLGLSKKCLCLCTDAVCNSFLGQLVLASEMIKSGQVRYALLVQSSTVSRIANYADWFSGFLGDGAAGVVLGPVPDKTGVLTSSHRTNSENFRGIVTTVENKQWYEEGRNLATIPDKVAARRTLFQTPDIAKEVLLEALHAANLHPEDVDFYACHQAAGNLREQTQTLVGMTRAKFVDTMTFAGTISGANIPLQLYCAKADNMIKSNNLVAMFSMGSGSTASAVILRWRRQ